MKIAFRNNYFFLQSFNSYNELNFFLSKKDCKKLLLHERGQSFYYALVESETLNQKELSVLAFSSDSPSEKLFFTFWPEADLKVLADRSKLYLVDHSCSMIADFEISTPLIGLHITNTGTLLILEEAAMKLVDRNGKVMLNEGFDLIHDFSIQNDLLVLDTYSGEKVFSLA